MATPIREIVLTNSMSGKKEKLHTLKPGKLTLYSCGPTVYGFIHIGNLRAALVSDLFFRYLKKAGYAVTYVRNYTDVDDKIIKRAHEENTTLEEITKKYILEVEKDYSSVGMIDPTHKTTVTAHIPHIVQMIEKILKNGHAYVVEGEVLFSIQSFKGYGKLSHKNIDELMAGARVEVSEKKKNPLDFTLWKPAKSGEPAWDSPWGKGRPGWHIECSAMSSRWLGDQIDLHHGGEDLAFPHHENEIAQSEAASGKSPFVSYWLHNAFVNLSNEKMSKSLGNVMLARDFITKYGAEVSRYLLLSPHYRSIIDFNEETLEHALVALHRVYEAKAKALDLRGAKIGASNPNAEALWNLFVTSCEKTRDTMAAHLANDFNVPGCLADFFVLIRDFNRTLASRGAENTPGALKGAAALICIMEDEVGGILGIGKSEPKSMLKELTRIRSERSIGDGTVRPADEEIQQLIQARANARQSKQFEEADRIRKDLESRGVRIKDNAGGTTWEYI